MSESMLVFEADRIGYGECVVVADVRLEVARAATQFLVGENGTGKSTLLRAIARLTTGATKLEIAGRDLLTATPRELAAARVYIGQRTAPSFGYSIAEVISWGGFAKSAVVDVTAAASIAGIREPLNTPVDRLSGGQWARVQIARAIAQDCELWLLDEADAALDAKGRNELYEYLGSAKKTVVAISHDLGTVRRFASAVSQVAAGSVSPLAVADL